MVAITPLAISFLMISMGLFSIFCARSRMTTLVGSCMLVLIDHLQVLVMRSATRRSLFAALAGICERWTNRSHLSFARFGVCERLGMCLQPLTIRRGQFHLQGASEAAA